MRNLRFGANNEKREKSPTRRRRKTPRRHNGVQRHRQSPEVAMLVLIMTFCSLSSPNHCGEARLQFAADESLMQCMMQAQPYIAQWTGEHPNARVTRWRCAYPEREEQPI
jgi:hypothetical protein